jgi:ketosteroid isomerase-like protein
LDGLAILIVDMNTKDCEMVSANYAEKAAVIRLRGTTAAVEGVEKMAEFWEAAAAMLEAAEVTTLGELLEDDEG